MAPRDGRRLSQAGTAAASSTLASALESSVLVEALAEDGALVAFEAVSSSPCDSVAFAAESGALAPKRMLAGDRPFLGKP